MMAAYPGNSTYIYSAEGLRVSKTVGGATATLAWDDTAGVPQLIEDANDLYIYGSDGLPAERLGASAKQWLAVDGLGSVAVSIDTNGQIVSNQAYDSWGNVTGHTGDPVSLGRQSQYHDDLTGYDYLRARYYDPATGQFISTDPLQNVTGQHYISAGNSPINATDPTGLFGIPGTDWCVDIAGPNCHSNADGESLNWEDTKVGLGVTLGIVSVATGFEATGATGGLATGLAIASVGTGAGAAVFDFGPCLREGATSAACAGLAMGAVGAGLAAAPFATTAGIVTEGSVVASALEGLGVLGFSMGMAGLFADAAVSIFGDPTLEGPLCDEQ